MKGVGLWFGLRKNGRSLNEPPGITKYISREVPAFKVSFMVIGLSEEEIMDEDDGEDDLTGFGMFEVRPWKKNLVKCTV